MNNTKVKFTAKDARKLYFEDYVEFEHNLKDLLKSIDPILKIKARMKSAKIIYLIRLKKKGPIKTRKYKTHLRTRHWLAHTRKNNICSGRNLENVNAIKQVNLEIRALYKK